MVKAAERFARRARRTRFSLKATGNGHREAGIAALDVFSEWKSIYVDFSGRLQRAQMDTEQI